MINYVTKLQEPGKTCNQISRAIKVSEQFVKRVCKCLATFKYIDNQNMFRFFAIDDMNIDANKLLETFKLTEHEHVLLCMKLEKVGLTYDELDSECKPMFRFTDILMFFAFLDAYGDFIRFLTYKSIQARRKFHARQLKQNETDNL